MTRGKGRGTEGTGHWILDTGDRTPRLFHRLDRTQNHPQAQEYQIHIGYRDRDIPGEHDAFFEDPIQYFQQGHLLPAGGDVIRLQFAVYSLHFTNVNFRCLGALVVNPIPG